ncbi:hypothetical protein C8Q77DRAFT_1027984, partial [Trametes polyzona]
TLRKHHFKSYKWVGQEAGGYTESQVCRTAITAGYHRRTACPKPFLSARAIQKRLKWAQENRKRNWLQLVWTDEMSLRLGEVVTAHRVTRGPGEAYLPETVTPSFPTPSKQTIMVWGCIAHGKKGPLVRLSFPDERKASGWKGGRGLDAEGYVKQVLEGPLWDFCQEVQAARGVEVLVVEDGA